MDPQARRVTVYVLAGQNYADPQSFASSLPSTVLPGLRLDLQELFKAIDLD